MCSVRACSAAPQTDKIRTPGWWTQGLPRCSSRAADAPHPTLARSRSEVLDLEQSALSMTVGPLTARIDFASDEVPSVRSARLPPATQHDSEAGPALRSVFIGVARRALLS